MREVRELAAFFVRDGGSLDPELGRSLVERCAAFHKDIAIRPEAVPTDALDDALALAEEAGFVRLQELEEKAQGEIDAAARARTLQA